MYLDTERNALEDLKKKKKVIKSKINIVFVTKLKL